MARVYSADTDGNPARIESDFSAEGTSVAPGTTYGTLYRVPNTQDGVTAYDLSAGEVLATGLFTGADPKRGLCFNEDGTLMYCACGAPSVETPFVLGRFTRAGAGPTVLNDDTITLFVGANDVAVDTAAGYVFSFGASVYRFDLDGGNAVALATGLSNTTTGDVDRVNGRVYYLHGSQDLLSRLYDGTGLLSIDLGGSGSGGGVFVDPAAGYVFVRGRAGIHRCPLDLSGSTEIVSGLSTQSNPLQALICGDPTLQRLYHVVGTQIISVDYDGADAEVVYEQESNLGLGHMKLAADLP